MHVAARPLINPVWIFLFTGEIPGKWAFIGGSLVLAAVTVRGIVTATRGPGGWRHHLGATRRPYPLGAVTARRRD
jgi:hypothetical protein